MRSVMKLAEKISYGEKHIESKLSGIGAKVVTATEKSFAAKKLCEESNRLLMDVQTEIADLYESLGDVLAAPGEENERSEATEINQSSSPQD